MPSGMFLDPFAAGLGVAGTAYNLWANKRDFDYQKSLQQQIFEREDTAVQRRMADLQAAGLNPNLAAGSAAGAGSIVARSNTNDVDFGKSIDMSNAVQQLRQQKYQTKLAQFNTETAHVESIYKIHQLLSDMGLETMPYFENGKLHLLTPDDDYPTGGTTVPFEQSTAKINQARDVMGKIIREQTDLQNKLTQTTKDMILGKAQISNWSLNNTLDVFNALSGRNLKISDIELQAEKLGIDIKKMNFQQMIQSLPLLMMIFSTF